MVQSVTMGGEDPMSQVKTNDHKLGPPSEFLDTGKAEKGNIYEISINLNNLGDIERFWGTVLLTYFMRFMHLYIYLACKEFKSHMIG